MHVRTSKKVRASIVEENGNVVLAEVLKPGWKIVATHFQAAKEEMISTKTSSIRASLYYAQQLSVERRIYIFATPMNS